jgi:hypothetical protein
MKIYKKKKKKKKKKGANLIWKFVNQKVNVFGPAHIEKPHFKGIFECIF